MANKKERCPRCGAWVTGLPVHNKTLAQGVKAAVGLIPVVGQIANASGLTETFTQIGEDAARGKLRFHFECGCGYEWDMNYGIDEPEENPRTQMSKLEKWNIKLKELESRVKRFEGKIQIEKKNANVRDAFFPFFKTLVIGALAAYLDYYCWEEPFEYKAMKHDFIFGDYEATLWHWSWLGMFLLAIPCTIAFITFFPLLIKKCKEITNANRNLKNLTRELDNAKSDLEAHIKTKPSA